MTLRQSFVQYVRHGGHQACVSLQIGAGAGFDAKLAGKQWNSEATIADTLAAYAQVGGLVLVNVGLPEPGEVVPAAAWNTRTTSDDAHTRIIERALECPFGLLQWRCVEQPRHGATPRVYPVTMDTDNPFDIIRWYADQYGHMIDIAPELLGPVLTEIGQQGAVSVQWNLQPFELFGLASVDTLAMLASLEADAYRRTCDHIRDINAALARAVVGAGADFVFLGGPAAEMISPSLYEQFIIPDSEVLSEVVHEAGGLVYSHICSPIEPFLTMGFYNRMGIDLFETLSPPPVGNVDNLADARRCLDRDICTRGNIGLDVLLQGPVERIEQATIEVLQATSGYKHMVAASDYLFYDVPLEHVRAVVRTVQQW